MQQSRLPASKRPLSVDGVRRRTIAQPRPNQQRQSARRSAVASPPQQPLVPMGDTVQKSALRPHQAAPPQRSRPRRAGKSLQLFLLTSGSIIAGFLAQSLAIGLAIIVVYGAISLIKRTASNITFALAFFSLLAVVLLLVVQKNVPLASNFATYTFLLMTFGIASLILESRPAKHHKSLRRKR